MGELGVKAVILAGGRGRRLEPYTSVLPKPLMPVGDRAIIEIIVDRLVESGVNDVTLCVGYLAHLIEAIFNGRPRGARLSYVHETPRSALRAASARRRPGRTPSSS